MGKITRRTQLREIVFLILFRADYYEVPEMEGQIREFFLDEEEFTDQEKQEVGDKVLRICRMLPEIDARLDEISVGWKVKRMNHADLTALRLAYYEMYYDDTVPIPTAINDAVEFAKNYGTDNSGSFVNGVLAKAAREKEKAEHAGE